MIVKSIAEQTIFDVALWKYGTLQQIAKLVRDNDIFFDYNPPTGTSFSFFLNFGNEDHKEFYVKNNLIPVSQYKGETSGEGVNFWGIEIDFIVQ